MTDDASWENYVESLEDDDEVDSALHYERLVQEGPPVPPLEFPTPTLFPAMFVSLVAMDHRNGKCRRLKNVLIRGNSRSSSGPTRAFFLRSTLAKTTHGSIRVAVVLRRTQEKEEERQQQEDDDEVPQQQQRRKVSWITTEELVTVKISSWTKVRRLRGRPHVLEDPLREVAALQYVGSYNPHVVGCIEVLQDVQSIYTIMPYSSEGKYLHGRLFAGSDHSSDRIPPPDEDEARMIFRQLLKGLWHLQCKGVFHRDISLDTLLISKSNQLTIVDLGRSLRVPYSDPCNDGAVTDVSEGTIRRLMALKGKGGRPMYLAPEAFADIGGYDGFAVDLWAAGVVLFLLCVGLAPFKYADPREKRYRRISRGGLRSMIKNLKISLSPEACDLLQNMLWEDPRHRLSLVEVMKHPWVMGKPSMNHSIPPEDNDVCDDGSVVSQASTEPTDGSKSDLDDMPDGAHEIESLLDATPLDPEARETLFELRDSPYSEVLKHVHLIGPTLRNTAQRFVRNGEQIGPRVKRVISGRPCSTPPPF
jgi:serine/threonine protein kinase